MEEYKQEIVAGVSSVLVAIISVIGALLTRSKERTSREELAEALEQAMATIAEKEAELQQHNAIRDSESKAMQFEHQFALNTRKHMKFQKLCEETEIDRIFAFIAWNGAGEPTRTTAIYHIRLGEQMQVDFKYVPIDDHYRDMLRLVERTLGGVTYVTKKLPKGVLMETIYTPEGVLASHLIMLRKKAYAKGVCLSYMSFATHETDKIAPATLLRIQSEVNDMRGLAGED